MNLPFFFAKKYFRSKKKKNFINIISNFSMFGVAVGTMALILVLSVFNGLENLIRTLYGTFDPEIKIEASVGKTFELSPDTLELVKKINGVEKVTQVLEDYVYLKYRDSQMAVIMKGVEENFLTNQDFKESIIQGSFKLTEGDINYAIVGRGVQYALSVNPENPFEPLQVHYVKDIKSGLVDPTSLINKQLIFPAGFFLLEKQLDESYIIVPIRFAKNLFGITSAISSLELTLLENANIKQVQEELKNLLGEKFNVLNSDEQHASILRTIKIEKIFVFLIFTFILAVASFNIFFSLTMLAIEKKKDISVLYALGANSKLIRRIFLFEGMIISFAGAGIGLLLGLALGWGQQQFGLVSMGMQTAILHYYPVELKFSDFIFTGISIIVITLLASFRPAIIATRFNKLDNLQ